MLEEECAALRAQLAESRLRAVQAEQQVRQVQAQAEGTARELASARHDAVLQADATQQQVALREERLQAELQVCRCLPGLCMLMMRRLLPGCTQLPAGSACLHRALLCRLTLCNLRLVCRP